MLRSSLVAASAVILCSTATAQVGKAPMPSTAKDAGVYHVATGTWTRNVGQDPAIGPDTIYRADIPSGYFGTGWINQQGVDEGMLPGTGHPFGGTDDTYVVDGFTFGYCTQEPTTISVEFIFYDGYAPCDLPSNPSFCVNQVGGPLTVSGAPGGSVNACWLVTLDLMGGYEVTFDADGGSCNPGYDGAEPLDHFGWSAEYLTSTALTGPILSGYDPDWAPRGEGTCYNTSLTCPSGATAAGSRDFFAIDGTGALAPGCYFFGGYNNPKGCGNAHNSPGAQFWFMMFTECGAGDTGTPFCQTGSQQGSIAANSESLSVSGGVELTISGLAALGGQFAYAIVSDDNTANIQPPGSQGSTLCLGAPQGRYRKDLETLSGGDSYTLNLQTNSHSPGGNYELPSPPGGNIMSGDTWHFQNWTRNGPGDARFSEGLTLNFTP